MNRTTLRRAAKSHRCSCGLWIHPPDQYLEHVISPDHDDVGNTSWWRAAECRACAVSCDRWPVPNGGVMQR